MNSTIKTCPNCNQTGKVYSSFIVIEDNQKRNKDKNKTPTKIGIKSFLACDECGTDQNE